MLRTPAALAALAALSCALPLAEREPSEPLLANARQLTFEGRRAGEGYFSADGRQLVFQSERQPDNPFYQIYRMNLETGDVARVSPGYGKTTCAWIHPDGARVLFASTHDDPEAREKQRAELELRASGEQRRYSWDFDPAYELYAAEGEGSPPRRLTNSYGYDAEGSYSPDGQWIVFASNRHAYAAELDLAAREQLELDPSREMDLYLMRADGRELRRLTDTPGYDGGPFFSPDGSRIVWRRFAEDGVSAEVLTMARDGSDRRQLTSLGAMSWAPFYHPSGAYVIFATNRHGFANFELYLVDDLGAHEPARVTDSEGFDGLPVFSPDGARLAWTRKPAGADGAQIWLADWNHGEALRWLSAQPGAAAAPAAAAPAALIDASIRAVDLRRHVEALTGAQMAGRATGSDGEISATAYVAEAFAALGLEPDGAAGSWFQPFEFTAGVSLGPGNALAVAAGGRQRAFRVDEQWRPLALSRSGVSGAAPVAFVGYGIVAPARDGSPAYDAYGDLDVAGRWVLILRFVPEHVSPKQRQHLSRYAGLRYKAMLARERGALGVLFVAGPHSTVKDPLVKLAHDAALAGTSVFGLSLRPEVATALLAPSGQDLAALQAALDTGEPEPGFAISGVTVSAAVDLRQERSTGRNVIGRLRGGNPQLAPVVIGAHVDHLAPGSGASLAKRERHELVHPGADDNASGVAALLEIAAWLAARDERLLRDVVFAAWSGEELGLLGSAHYTDGLAPPDPHGDRADREIAAYLNMDMIGRMNDKLVLHGVGSSSIWSGEIERRNVPVGLRVSAQQESYLPTDATPFYLKGVPILSAFTGAHPEYHTPDDTAEKLDYDAAAKIARLMGGITRSLATSEAVPDYVAMQRPGASVQRAGLRVYLGTIPDYAHTDVTGVALSGVVSGGPADRAGLRAGDVIVRLGDQSVENIYDYTYALEGLSVGDKVELHVVRDGERVTLTVTPESRD